MQTLSLTAPAPLKAKASKRSQQKFSLDLAHNVRELEKAKEALRNISSCGSERQRSRILVDLAVIGILSAIVFTVGHVYDVFDPAFNYFAFKNNQLDSNLDEVVATMVFFCGAMFVFSYRRWQESRAEVLSQTQISEALGILNKEMEAQVQQRTAQLIQTNEDLRSEIAERQRAETIIKQFPAIVESSDDAIFSKSLDGIITTWNPAAKRMFGYTASEIIGKPITLLIPPNRSREEIEISALVCRGERLQHFETVRIRKDGRPLDVSATISPIKDAVGNITGVSGILRDIAERKRTQKALIASERKFRAIFDGATDAIFMLHKGVFVDCNSRGLQLFGVEKEKLLGQPPFIQAPLIQPDGRNSQEKAREIIEKVEAGDAQRFEWLHCRPDGTEIYSEVSLNRLELNGEIYMQGIVRDITERKRAEAQIAEQAAFLDKAQDAIVVRDLAGNALFWNKGAERIYGWSSQEVMGRNLVEILHTNPKKFEEINDLTISQGEWHGELPHVAKNGSELTIETRCTLIRDNEGRPKSVLAINTDITEKKKIEAQFMRAQRMESIGTLAGGIAHDLNNILAPIMMSIDVLKITSDNPRAKEILETIDVSAKRGADIVRQVLSFARGLEGQRIEVQPKHLLKDLGNIIKDTFPKDIRLQFCVPSDIWTILGDPTQVHQILLNLCVNARDAMPNGGSLTIGVENCVIDEQYSAMNMQAKAGRYVSINVTDTGTGIPQDILNKIFEPFFTTKDLAKGTGLGLSTVMAVVKSHEGIINVYSEPGKGTTFKVYLPAMDISSDVRKDHSEQISLPRGNGETVLVVDDEASILTITSQTLQAFGYRVLTAADGAEAVTAYAEHKNEIAVVLTDMAMPVMDGPATIRALLRINPALKIVAVSGLNTNAHAAKASGAGIKHFLTKPYTAGTLLKTVRSILDEARSLGT